MYMTIHIQPHSTRKPWYRSVRTSPKSHTAPPFPASPPWCKMLHKRLAGLAQGSVPELEQGWAMDLVQQLAPRSGNFLPKLRNRLARLLHCTTFFRSCTLQSSMIRLRGMPPDTPALRPSASTSTLPNPTQAALCSVCSPPTRQAPSGTVVMVWTLELVLVWAQVSAWVWAR